MRHLAALAVLVFSLIVGGCSSAATQTSLPAAAGTTPAVAPSDPAITLTIPSSVPAGKTFEAAWTGAETPGDFFVIVPAGAATWTESADSPGVNATMGNPAKLTAPKAPGAYEVWFLKGDTEGPIIVKARAPISVTPAS